jgi:hypothetical protein
MNIFNLMTTSNMHCLHSNQSCYKIFKTKEKKESGGLVIYESSELRHLFYHISIIIREKIQRKSHPKKMIGM